MEVNKQPSLSFLGVDIVNVNFKVEKYIETRLQIDTIETTVVPKIHFKEGTKHFSIILECTCRKEDYFLLEVGAIGHFECSDDLTEDIKKFFINHNAPAIVFPYVRSFVSTFSVNAGSIPKITIPTQFFKGDFEENMYKEEE